MAAFSDYKTSKKKVERSKKHSQHYKPEIMTVIILKDVFPVF